MVLLMVTPLDKTSSMMTTFLPPPTWPYLLDSAPAPGSPSASPSASPAAPPTRGRAAGSASGSGPCAATHHSRCTGCRRGRRLLLSWFVGVGHGSRFSCVMRCGRYLQRLGARLGARRRRLLGCSWQVLFTLALVLQRLQKKCAQDALAISIIGSRSS